MYGMNWKETITNLTKDFAAFGCRYKGKKLRETALGYDCTELFFWNWMDGECDRSEKGTGWTGSATGARRVSCGCWATPGGGTWRRRKTLRLREKKQPPLRRLNRKADRRKDQMMPNGIRTMSSTATSPHSVTRNAFRFFGSMSGT